MKNLFAILLGALLAISHAHAQFVPGPAPQTALVCGTGFIVPGSTTTNIPPSLAPFFRAGRDGVFMYVQGIGTNSTATTNATVILQPLGGPEGTNVLDNQTYTFSFGQNGTTSYEFGTNLASSLANMLNVPALQLKSIQNTNTTSIIISNITAYVR